MSGLVLKLTPHERVLVNGAVIENGDRRSKLSILTPNANILRLKDAIRPEDATTPVRRVCYIAQLILSGDADPDEAQEQILQGISQLSQVFFDDESLTRLTNAKAFAENGDHYRTLKALRALIVKEDFLMERTSRDGS